MVSLNGIIGIFTISSLLGWYFTGSLNGGIGIGFSIVLFVIFGSAGNNND